MKWVVCLLAILCFADLISAATIYGTIYDISLNKMENIIVEINTQPKQQYISKNGTYAFNVPIGEYTIEAKHYTDDIIESSSKEKIAVRGEGNFVLDMVLFPVVDSELAEETEDISVDDDYFREKRDYSLIILFGAIIIILLAAVYFIKMKRIAEEGNEKSGVKEQDYYNGVLSIIKENKRITQKEIRKQIPLSEAKISLIITELEHKGLVEKIKKGRGNIIILKKS